MRTVIFPLLATLSLALSCVPKFQAPAPEAAHAVVELRMHYHPESEAFLAQTVEIDGQVVPVTAPPHMDQLSHERQDLPDGAAGEPRIRFEATSHREGASYDHDIGHEGSCQDGRISLPPRAATIWPSWKIVTPRRIVRRTAPRNE